MKNPFWFSDTNKRYHTFDYYLKNRYKSKVFKVAIDGGFTCPNRDGKVGYGGCIYCSQYGSGEFAGSRKESVLEQFESGKKIMSKKWPKGKYMPYFQAFSNTYAPVNYLRSCFEPFIGLENVVALDIATRPDCLSEEILDYLSDINKRIDLYLELGLQTIHNSTAQAINRGYDYQVFLNAVANLSQRNIKVIVHIINGLPGETKEMMIDTVKSISYLPIEGIKFHSLSVLKNTALETMFLNDNLKLLSKDEYLDIVSDQLTYLPSSMVVERIGTDAKQSELIAPKWNIKKVSLANDLDKLMVKKNSYQSINFHISTNSILYYNLLSYFPQIKGLAIDATVGNDNDVYYLVNHYKTVLGFSLKEQELNCDRKLFTGYNNLKLINDSFINIDKYITQPIDFLLYKLGNIPGQNQTNRVNVKDIISSLKNVLPLLSESGICVLAIYTDKDNDLELTSILHFLDNFPSITFISTKLKDNFVIKIKKSK